MLRLPARPAVGKNHAFRDHGGQFATMVLLDEPQGEIDARGHSG